MQNDQTDQNHSTSKIRAILKPNGYRAENKLFIKEPLFDYGSSPVIAYGYDKESYIEYTAPSDEQSWQNTFDHYKKHALENNANIQVDYKIHEIEGEKMLVAEQHEYASEKILDKHFLQAVSEALGSSTILVGIPYKGLFAAIPSDNSNKGKFMGFIVEKYNNPAQDPISPHIFKIVDGEFYAAAITDKDDSQESQQNAISTKSNGDYIVELYSEDLTNYKSAVTLMFQHAALAIVGADKFSGRLIFNENRSSFTFDKVALDTCKQLKKDFDDNEMIQTLAQAMHQKGIETIFTHQGEELELDMTTISETPDEITEHSSSTSTSTSTNKTTDHTAIQNDQKKWWQIWK